MTYVSVKTLHCYLDAQKAIYIYIGIGKGKTRSVF